MRPSRTPRHYLLVPPEPTPNGGLHLGHIAGPFLRMDVIARYLRMRGDVPVMMTGTDTFEPWVAMQARIEGVAPEEVARRHHQVIADDLAAMRIEVDEYINPADHPWKERFQEEIREVVARFERHGEVSTVVEKVPCDPRTGRFIVGPLLLGRCPDCGGEVAAYGCEACGAHFRPEEVLDPRARFPQDRLEWREIKTQFVRVADLSMLEAQLETLQTRSRDRDAVRALVRRDGARVRLSAPHSWGMTLPNAEDGATLFSYTGCFMFARMLGELHGQRIGSGINSFDNESDVITITSLGCDNAVATLVGINGLAPVHGGSRPYDRCLINDFYHLDGRKFSTSRGHVIGASAVSAVEGLEVDAVRHYLALVNPEEEVADFVPQAFLDHVNLRLARQLEETIARTWMLLPSSPGPMAGSMRVLLNDCLRTYQTALDSPRVCLRDVVTGLDEWTDSVDNRPGSPDGRYWWLKSLAVLAYPVMPDIGARIWAGLGAEREPTLAAFDRPTRPTQDQWQRHFRRVEPASFASCLPGSLR